jgi:hypothetical protein
MRALCVCAHDATSARYLDAFLEEKPAGRSTQLAEHNAVLEFVRDKYDPHARFSHP